MLEAVPKKYAFGVPLFVVAAIGGWILIAQSNRPQDSLHDYRLTPGQVSRLVVLSRRGSPARRRSGPPRLAQRIRFEATESEVEIIVVPFPGKTSEDSIAEIQRMVEEFRRGDRPSETIIGTTGANGALNLNWWPWGSRKYIVLMQADQPTHVTLTVQY